jgi:hypothetical protein
MTPLEIVMLGRSGASSLDADAVAWGTAVTAAGGTYSGTTLSALSTFIKSAKANSYWTKIVCFNPIAGNQLTAALIQYTSGSWASATNHNFVNGDYTEATGITGNGSTKYIDTGLVPATSLTLNSTHLAIYNRSSSASASGGVHIGADDAARSLRLFAPFTDGTCYLDMYDTANGRVSSAALASAYGFVIGSRTASNAEAIYRNGSSLATSSLAQTSGLPIGQSTYVFCRNFNGAASNFVAHVLAAYSIGAGLSSTDATNFNTDMQAFQLALSRNV